MTLQEHLLTIFAEECAELAKEISKGLRFGLDATNDKNALEVRDRIAREFFDVVYLQRILVFEGIIDDVNFDFATVQKQAKLSQMILLAHDRGFITDLDTSPLKFAELVRQYRDTIMVDTDETTNGAEETTEESTESTNETTESASEESAEETNTSDPENEEDEGDGEDSLPSEE